MEGQSGNLASMGRPKRTNEGGLIYHAWIRANARMTVFEKDEEDAAFERIIREAKERTDMRIIAYCLMPHHILCGAPHDTCSVQL